MTKILNKKLVNKMMKDKLIRTEITKQSFFLFFHFYYAHYVKYETANFQKEIFGILENESVKNFYIVAFRGSGKSTLVTTSYPIWAILGRQQFKFCLILSQTRNQAKQHMMSIKKELEDNELLKKDLGPFSEESDEWGSYSLVFKKHNARITVGSSEQSIRGIRHNEYRPDLIILDDVEDLQSTKTREGREKVKNWLTGEVIPCGDKNTRLVIVGNLLHDDSLLMGIKKDLEDGKMSGVFKFYPIVDEQGKILWPGKYPDMDAIEVEKKRVGSEIAWHREYLLKIIVDEEQIIDPKWIKYYSPDALLNDNYHTHYYTGIDLAISLKDTADYTAMVTAKVQGYGKELTIYILPNIVNKKMTGQDTIEQAEIISRTSHHSTLLVEDNGMQKIFIELLKADNYKAEGVRSTVDKHSRLASTSSLIQSGKVFFPDKGAELLVQQLTSFGREKHDDLADAFSLLLLKIIEKHSKRGCFGTMEKFDRL